MLVAQDRQTPEDMKYPFEHLLQVDPVYPVAQVPHVSPLLHKLQFALITEHGLHVPEFK